MPEPRAVRTRLAGLPRGVRDALLAPPRWWRELILIALIFGVYRWIQTQVEVWVGAAVARGERLLQTERTLHIAIEQHLNTSLAGHPAFAVLANYYYTILHGAVTCIVLIWLFWWRPRIYPSARLSLAVTTVTAFVVFATVPTAPPRLLPHAGFVDTLTNWHTVGAYDSGVMAHTADQFAAMPSLHIAWSVWAVLYTARAIGRRWIGWPLACYPVMTGYVIVATANHYVLDIVGGLAVVVIGETVRWMVVQLPGRSARRQPGGPKEPPAIVPAIEKTGDYQPTHGSRPGPAADSAAETASEPGRGDT